MTIQKQTEEIMRSWKETPRWRDEGERIKRANQKAHRKKKKRKKSHILMQAFVILGKADFSASALQSHDSADGIQQSRYEIYASTQCSKCLLKKALQA